MDTLSKSWNFKNPIEFTKRQFLNSVYSYRVYHFAYLRYQEKRFRRREHRFLLKQY